MTTPDPGTILHATTICAAGQAVLILGASGRGKSGLALQLIALGAGLVSDDRTSLTNRGGVIYASPPQAIAGRIEARGVGLLRLPFDRDVPVALVVDLDREEPDRLPHPHTHAILGATLPCLWAAPGPHFPAAILLWLKGHSDPQ